MKKNWIGKLAAGVLACSLACNLFMGAGSSAAAATFDDINQDDVFFKQEAGSSTCTLVSATMLIRRAAMMNGDDGWSDITEDAVRSVGWLEGVGLKWNFSYQGITVAHDGFSGDPEELQTKLEEHPEGIVLYKKKSDQQHAVLVTDYTDGVFYCADPSRVKDAGRIPIDVASIAVEDSNYIWYVAAPTVYLTDESGDTVFHEVETAKPTVAPKPTATARPTAGPKVTAIPEEEDEEEEEGEIEVKPGPAVMSTEETEAPRKVSGLRVKNNKYKTLTVTWGKVSGAKGYQIRFGTTRDLSNSSSITLGEKRRAILTGLKKGRTFYVKVRAYNLNGKKKVYGSYSSVKNRKVKK